MRTRRHVFGALQLEGADVKRFLAFALNFDMFELRALGSLDFGDGVAKVNAFVGGGGGISLDDMSHGAFAQHDQVARMRDGFARAARNEVQINRIV